MRITTFRPEFVPFTIPEREEMEEGVLYISEEFNTAIHLCACGCGVEVVTPLGAGRWTLTRAGEGAGEEVSLSPSIGNFQIPCGSHYWITGNAVLWCGGTLQT